METPIRPDSEDVVAIEREYGPLTPLQLADDKVCAHRYRLAHKHLRLQKAGALGPDMEAVKRPVEEVLGISWQEE